MGSRPAPPGGACQCSDRSRRCIGLAAAAAWIAAALCWSVVRFPSAADLLGRQAAAPAAEAAPPTAEALGSVAAAAAAEAADLGAGRLPPEARGSGGALPVAAGGAQPGRGPLPGGPPRPQGRTQQDAPAGSRLVAPPRLAAGRRPAAARAPAGTQNRFCFLRIQKTGSTTLGDGMLKELCPICNPSDLLNHNDWSILQQCPRMITILRDPLERILSEFFMIRTDRFHFDDKFGWDMPAAPYCEEIWTALNRNFTEYLHIKRNPARNRQTLYLAGMGKQKYTGNLSEVTPRILKLSKYSVEVREQGVDWDYDGQEILERAKSHLRDGRITVGINEHFECSLRLFSKALGWDAERALAMSRELGMKRHQDKDRVPLELLDGHAVASPTRGERRWADVIDGWLRAEIERLQVADRELYQLGKEVFQSQAQKFGLECPSPEGAGAS